MIYKSYKKMFGVKGCAIYFRSIQVTIHPESNECYIIDRDTLDNIDYFKFISIKECLQRIRNDIEIFGL